jgi:hypothetical protein
MVAGHRCRFIVGGLLLVGSIGAPRVEASSCAMTCKKESECVKQAFANASAVFVGTPLEVTLQNADDKPGPHSFSTANYRVRLRVKELFKGLLASEVVSNNGVGGGADGSYGEMEQSRDYLIYASFDEGRTGVAPIPCGRTQPINAEPLPDFPNGPITEKMRLRARKAIDNELRLLRSLNKKTHPVE